MNAHRQHTQGHNYYDAGIYLITVVVKNREPLLGALCLDARQPRVELTDLGRAVEQHWNFIPEHSGRQGRSLQVYAFCAMPDHIHGVIEVQERMDVSIGRIVRDFKAACTHSWRELTLGFESPTLAIQTHLSHLSAKQRQQFYDSDEGRRFQPLFDDNYDDTICLANRRADGSLVYDKRHFDAMLRYVEDNPRRAVIRKLHPDFMRRCMHICIAGRDYAAFGNLFLLKWADKRQVFFHRKVQKGQRDGSGNFYPYGTPYEQTIQFAEECRVLLTSAREGESVLVTPGISKGEQIVKATAIAERLPLIHIQAEPIGEYWKPERIRFDACAEGTLLILAPWKLSEMARVRDVPSDSQYSQFHNLNALAEEICNFLGIAIIKNNFLTKKGL